jgi:O-antigen/teichoic acid export membrane protein
MMYDNGTEYPDWLLFWTVGTLVFIVLGFLAFLVGLFFFPIWATYASFVTALSLLSLVVCIHIGHRYKPHGRP